MEKTVSKTTTVGIVIKDHVILAADKRATAGPMVYHKAVKKIAKITDYSALTISGLVADAQFLIENARYFAKLYELRTLKPISLRSLATRLALILSIYLRQAPFIVQLLLGGHDLGGPALYYIDLYGTISTEKYMATGSGSPLAFGVLESEYREDMGVQDAVNLAFKAIATALLRDGYSGEGVDIVVIGPGIYEEKTIPIKRTPVSS
ncbi:MAG: proteasome subunit beta [Desulfurococcaceae archaeon]